MGMCVLYRKRGQTIKVREPNGRIYIIRFDGISGDRLEISVDEKPTLIPVDDSMYIDSGEIAMLMPISIDGSLRIGIDAPRSWDIARGEIPFRK